MLPYIDFTSNSERNLIASQINEFKKLAIHDSISSEENYVSAFSKDEKVNDNEKELFAFDPNTIDSITFLELGLSPKQAKVICNFRRKGGRFYNQESFKKIYGISPKLFEKLRPYIAIEESRKSKDNFEKPIIKDTNNFRPAFAEVKKEELIVEINDADSTILKRLPKVGRSFASRIINYRDKLGGFVSKNQLFEVYGVDSSLFQTLEKHIVIDTNNVRKTNINTCNYYTLKNFPYLRQSQVTALIRYKDNHGPFQKLTDIKKCLLIDELTYQKMKPYFKTSN